MVGKKVQKEEIANAISVYLADTTKHPGIESTYDDETDTYLLKDANKKEITVGPGWACSDDSLKEELYEIMQAARDAKSEGVESNLKPVKRVEAIITSTALRKGQDKPLVHSSAITNTVEVEDVLEYLCPKATQKEAMIAVNVCKNRGMNPWTGDVHFIKYGESPMTIVASKEYFMRKAENHSKFDGMKAGIIVKSKDGIITDLEGTFYDEETLIGGWATVWRKDRKEAFVARVRLSAFNTGKAQWAKMPEVMIRKCAEVAALREAFPSDLGGLYNASEITDAECDIEVT